MGRKKRVVDIETPTSSPGTGEGSVVSKNSAASAGMGEGLGCGQTGAASAGMGENVVPDLVCMLAKELHEDPAQLLGWHVYPDKVVIVGRSGMKFSKAVSNGI